MQSALRITVNGRPVDVTAAPETPLLYVLRNDLQLNGPKFGCGLSQCGACTVLAGDQAIRSCATPVGTVTAPITTVEGLGTEAQPDAIQAAFREEQAGQCAYCIPGMMMTATSLLRRNPSPSDDEIKTALNGNLCRCASHLRIVRAVRRASANLAKGGR